MNKSIYTSKLEKILKKGDGIKVGLFDERAKLVISTCVPHSVFLENDFFLLQDLEVLREKIGNVICCLFAESQSIPKIIKELKDPRYGVYNINFLNKLNSLDMERLAAADIFNVINEICEININCICTDVGLVTLYSRYIETISNYDICNKLEGLLSTLGISPTIYHTRELTKLAEQLNNTVKNANDKPGRLLMIDRSLDMITPLVYEWKYQSMIYEYTEYRNGLVAVGKQRYAVANDKLFSNLKFLEISKVPDLINIESKKRYKDADKAVLETHLIIANHILESCIKNSELSEVEFECLKNNFRRFESTMAADICLNKKIKLLLVYLYAKGFNFASVNDILTNKYIAKFPDLMCYIERYCQYVKKYSNKTIKNLKWNNDLDLKLSFIPTIPKFVKKFVENKNLDLQVIGNNSGINNLDIIYINGGVTYSEYRNIVELVGSKVQIVSDFIIGYKDIVENITARNNSD